MAKTNLKALRKVTQSGAPIERTVTWKVFATEENLEDLKELTGKSEVTVGDEVELEGQVFIKRLSFIAQQEVAKAFEWDVVTNPDDPVLKEINGSRLVASRLIGSICEDGKGTPFFTSLKDVYDSDPKFIDAVYQEADKVNNFTGKLLKKNSSEMNSGANSSSTESVEEPLKKRKQT
ncbi:hypothetical protein DCO44_14415 [Acinetobacter sp. AM]|uniref:phage tail assembly chaperone family protein, TAC n=1 Tax=Acinetobacter sp. AM TaxID=2170730 RepID=UPI000DE75FB6|nr:phage tail assembly chaperone family protein, TAC [Acinetobacter sp. AM]PWB13352.1 hypothetical protein DCO44_14415 [Acinetobacter sp. AM]